MIADKKMNKTVVILLICVLFIMALIFYFSSQPFEQSDKISKSVMKVILSWLMPYMDVNSISIPAFNHKIRKTAHFLLYFLLGFNLCFLFAVIKNRNNIILYSMLIGLFYAISDEFHQMFITGRGAKWQDVLLDFCSTAIGSAAALLLYKHLRKQPPKHIKTKKGKI